MLATAPAPLTVIVRGDAAVVEAPQVQRGWPPGRRSGCPTGVGAQVQAVAAGPGQGERVGCRWPDSPSSPGVRVGGGQVDGGVGRHDNVIVVRRRSSGSRPLTAKTPSWPPLWRAKVTETRVLAWSAAGQREVILKERRIVRQPAVRQAGGAGDAADSAEGPAAGHPVRGGLTGKRGGWVPLE